MGHHWLAAALLLSALGTVALAQGTQADYDRAAKFGALTQGKVTGTVEVLRWAADGSRLWYRVDLGGGRARFVTVDTATGDKRPAFDHDALAVALGKLLGGTFAADRLAVDGLDRSADGRETLLFVSGRVLGWDAAAGTLTPRPEAVPPLAVLPNDAPQSASPGGGERAKLIFLNRTAGPVECWWLSFEGKRQSYQKLAPGGRWEIATFAGHRWVVTAAQGQVLGCYAAGRGTSVALVDGQPHPSPRPPAPRRRRAVGSGPTSPDGRLRVTCRAGNVYLRPTASGDEVALTTGGTLGDGFGGEVWWSPDSTRFVVLHTVAAEEHKVYAVESSPADQVQPKLRTFNYLKPGDRLAVSKPQLFDAVARRAMPVADTLFPNPWSVSDVRWEADSSRFTFLYNQRGHQVLRVVAVDARTGVARALVDEQSPTFICYSSKSYCQWLDDTRELLWMSERDGWNHLYLYDARTGTVKQQITRGPWVVREVERVDETTRQLWFAAGGLDPAQDPYHVHHCRINFDGTGLTRLTEGDGTHSLNPSPDGRFNLDTWSRVDLPPVVELRRADTGARVCELERADASGLLKTGWRLPERFVAKGRDGQTDIWGVLIRPTTYDPARRYPVIEHIYAGPHGAFVPKAWQTSYGLNDLAELGFIVVQIDGMGTNWRSKAFHDVCWRNLADGGFPDRIAWLRAAAAKDPALDLTRVGIYGGSAGGQNALAAVLTHPEFYQAAAADCGCHDNRMDKVWWNEQWMGWPVGPEYAANSNVTLAKNLRGKLLLTVGELDNNVDPASTMQVVNALIKANKDFELIVFPGGGHGSGESPYGRRRRADFFVRSLLGVEPRR